MHGALRGGGSGRGVGAKGEMQDEFFFWENAEIVIHCVSISKCVCFILRRYMHCNTHATTHYNTLQHTATHCNTLQHTATHCNSNGFGVVLLLERQRMHCQKLCDMP